MNNLVYDITELRSYREMMAHSAAEYAERPAFVYRTDEDTVGEISYAEFYRRIKCLSAYMNSLGLENKRIAIIGKNRYEWALSYLTVGCGVGLLVPMDRESNKKDVAVMLADSEAAAVIYSPEKADCVADFTGVKLNMDELAGYIEQGAKLRDGGDLSYENHRVDPDAFAILLYTSATTGKAKGVMLSQRNVCSDICAVIRRLKMSPDDRALSVLPLHHTYETAAGFLTLMMCGGSIAYATSLKKFPSELVFFAPTVLAAVPLLLQNMLDHILKKVSSVKGGKLVFRTMEGISAVAGKFNINASRKIFSSVLAGLGGRLRMIICGAAPLPHSLQKAYMSFGIPVYNGYGMTEASPVCLMQNDMTGCDKPGIGLPLVGTMARLIDADESGIGELEVTGPNIMLGYYKNEEQTARVLRNGWLRTGDLARIDPRTGFYEIVGRLKNVIVTKGGKNIYPEELEFLLEKHRIIDSCMVCGYEDGEGNVTLAAIIYPNLYTVDEAMEGPVIDRDGEEYAAMTQKLVEQAIRDTNRSLSSVNSLRRYFIRQTDFIKTTTHKIKRADPENRPAVEQLSGLHSAISE